jgi:hypothetical protein
VWRASQLYLSVGSPGIRRAIARDPEVTVHLGSATDVVILEGRAVGPCEDEQVIATYDLKYDWSYQFDEYGPLTTIAPSVVLAWQVAGWAGRDGFRRSGRWEFTE